MDLNEIRSVKRRNAIHPLEYTLMMLTPDNQITIYPGGGYKGSLYTKGYMDNDKVSGLLPWDYINTDALTERITSAD